MGTPINLVRNDGGLIPLMCTTLVMNVDRRVVPIPVPLGGGSRLGFDLNLPGATITLEGIIADEDKFAEVGAKKASSTIDFDNVSFGIINFNFSTTSNFLNITDLLTQNTPITAVNAISLASGVDIYFTKNTTNFTKPADYNNYPTITVGSTDSLSVGLSVAGTGIPVGATIASITNSTTFELSASTTGGAVSGGTLTFSGFYGKHKGTGRNWVGLYNVTTSAARTAVEIAADFAALVNQETATFGMTATVITSPNNGTTNTAVKLQQNASGKAGNTNFPAFPIWASNSQKPFHTQFDGGKENTSASGYSAGDRVAELYAVLNNSNNGGLGIGNIASGLASAALSSVRLGGVIASGDKKYGDYIIGLQIPFTSTVNNNSSLFYMPTGPFKSVDDKTVDMAEPVGTEMITSFGPYEYTGIKGAVANATFTQLGGEPLYSFTINFVPIDWLI